MSTRENIKSRTLRCGKCEFTSTGGAVQLAKHLKEAHYNVENNKCQHCGYKSQTLGKMVFHMKKNHGFEDVPSKDMKHLEEESKLKVCTTEESLEKSLDKDNATMNFALKLHEEEGRKYVCDQCGKVFQKAWLLLNHRACVHEMSHQKFDHDQRDKPAVKENVSIEVSSSAPEVFKSSLETSGQDPHALRAHKGHIVPRKAERRRKANLQIQLKSDMEEEEYKCGQCTYTSHSKQHLRCHITSLHEKVRNHLCDLCGSSFFQEGSLESHMNMVHHMGVTYKCEQCPYKTIRKDYLMNHATRVHEKKWSHICDHCGVTFKQEYSLRRHLKTVHKMGEKYKCEQCHYESFAEGSVKRHFRAKHEKMEKN